MRVLRPWYLRNRQLLKTRSCYWSLPWRQRLAGRPFRPQQPWAHRGSWQAPHESSRLLQCSPYLPWSCEGLAPLWTTRSPDLQELSSSPANFIFELRTSKRDRNNMHLSQVNFLQQQICIYSLGFLAVRDGNQHKPLAKNLVVCLFMNNNEWTQQLKTFHAQVIDTERWISFTTSLPDHKWKIPCDWSEWSRQV